MDHKLTSFQSAHYKTFGFIRIKEVLNENELKVINSEFADGLEAAHKYNPGVGASAQLQWSNLKPEFPFIASLIEDSRICGVAEQLIGDDAIPVFSNSNRWVANTPWHPDTPYLELKGVKIACYLQSVRSNSGAIRFVPGSHKSEFNEEISALLKQSNPDLKDVPSHVCDSDPGDIIAFDNRLYHSAIGTSEDKRQLTMNFIETPKTTNAEKENQDLKAVSIKQYSNTNAPPPHYAPEWVANLSGNDRRQRSIDWLKSVGLI
ncbi:MAG: hypothetical protein CL768_00600 [Chloroflexi bacterium]|nr:hypothetical protein [Chloroflexota bacterium]